MFHHKAHGAQQLPNAEMTPDGLYISVNNSIEQVSSFAEFSLLGRSVKERISRDRK